MNWPRTLSLALATLLLVSLLLVMNAPWTLAQPEKPPAPDLPPDAYQRLGSQRADTPDAVEDRAPGPLVRGAVKKDRSLPLRSIPPVSISKPVRTEIPRLSRSGRDTDGRLPGAPVAPDPVLQDWQGTVSMPSSLQNFDGLDNGDNQSVIGFEIMPPDTQGDVGPNHYVQWVNLAFAIWDKSGNLLYGPAAGNTLWSGFGGPCQDTNDGDPITLYDPLADRWLMSQFALPSYPQGPFYQCIAISTSDDPTGSWYRYAFEWENGDGFDVMNDYPKFGVWPDAYYMTANQFSAGSGAWAGTGVAAFERDRMLTGQSPQVVYFDLGPSDWGSMLPADLDGFAPPPPGAPNYLVEANADEWEPGLSDVLQVYEFHVDWANPLNSTLTQVTTLPTAPFDGDMCGFSQDCIPQPDTSQRLDAIGDRLMHRLQYRNFGSHETLVTNLTVDTNGNDHAGVRWFELRRIGGDWSIHQQGTYAPDSDHRWMGSIAMDKVGNIALGYSVSGSSTYPSIRYAGRLANDPLGTLGQGEAELVAGSSYQAGGSRWGDYSMMAVDPLDDCTFWYTQQYVSEPGSWGNWNTRIGSFQFPGCLGPTGILAGIVRDSDSGEPIVGARVTAEADISYVTYSQSSSGNYRYEILPPDSYTVTAEAYGYQPQMAKEVDVLPEVTTYQDFDLAPAPMHVLSGRVTDSATGWPLYASIDIEGYPGNRIWTDPATGFYRVTLAQGTAYTAYVDAWVEGYEATTREIGLLAGDRTENFALTVDSEACTAPGYQVRVIGLYEHFDDELAPPGWSIVDNVGNGQVWEFDDPAARGNLTGGSGAFAIVDSDNYGWGGQQDTELRTPIIDFADLDSVAVEFDTDFLTFTGFDVASVDLSTDGGGTWAVIWQKMGSSYRGPAHEVIDVSDRAAGRRNVMVRFAYSEGFWEWWWQVDNVLLGQNLGCQPKAGGLVFGNVYDANTGEPLSGSLITNDSGEVETASDTPLDPAIDDALYVIFSPAGSHTFSATIEGGYGVGVEQVAVAEGEAVSQDFELPMGMLDYDPGSIHVALQIGRSRTIPLTIENLGGQPLDYEISELETGYQPAGPPHLVEVNIPRAELVSEPGSRMAKRHARSRPALSFVVEQHWNPSGAIEVLLLTPDVAAGGSIDLIEATLGAFADLNVTLWDAAKGDPSDDDLAAYDVVIVGNDYLWSSGGMSAEAIGNALADYIDGGGRVIDTLFVHDYSGWRLEGRYISEGYSPFTPSTTDMTAIPYSLGAVYDPGHPIMDGVTAIKDSPTIGIGHQDVGVARDAARLADWDDGQVFIAYKANVIGVNQLWYHGANWSGNVPELMHNAILYLTSGDVDWLAVDPISGTLDIAAQQVVSVTLDAGVLTVAEPGRYLAKLHLENSTAYGGPSVPVTMTVTLSPVCTEVVGLDLTLISTGTIYTNTQAQFSTDILPDDFAPPYSYMIDYGDGTTLARAAAKDDPLLFNHLYDRPGTYKVEMAAWNCTMTQAEAVTDTVQFQVRGATQYAYLPLINRNDYSP